MAFSYVNHACYVGSGLLHKRETPMDGPLLLLVTIVY